MKRDIIWLVKVVLLWGALSYAFSLIWDGDPGLVFIVAGAVAGALLWNIDK